MRKFYIIVIIVLICTVIAGCKSGNDVQVGSGASEEETILKVAGSTSVAPLIMELKLAYEEKNDKTSIEVQQTGSSSGITATIGGSADIGMSSRDLKQEELDQGLIERTIAVDGMAIIINNNNPIENLTKEQITSIYKGEITNWKDVGGDDEEIVVVSREEGSGTRSSFETILELEEGVERDGKKYKKSLITDNALFENSTGAVKIDVTSDQNAIGYISYGALDKSIKTAKVNGVEISEESILNDSYIIKRPFIICILGEANSDEKQFIDYILSEEGQNIVSEENYVKVR